MAPRPLAALVALLLARPRRALAWTTGNLVLSVGGDGTAEGSCNGTLAAALCAFSFEEFAVSGAAIARTGQTAAAPFATIGSLADPSNYAPFSSSLSLSDDGIFLTFVGYQGAVGTAVGVSNSGNLAGGVQTAVFINAPPAAAHRVIAYMDFLGDVNVCQGNLDALTTTPNVPANLDVWSAVWCSSCGAFYLTFGPNIGTTAGGIYYLPMPSGIAGPMGAAVQLTSSPTTSSATNLKMYTYIGLFNGVVYVARSGIGVSGGTDSLPGTPQTAAAVPLGSTGGNLQPVVGTVAAGISAAPLGSKTPHAWLFTTTASVTTFWQTDDIFGLSSFPGCTVQSVGTHVHQPKPARHQLPTATHTPLFFF